MGSRSGHGPDHAGALAIAARFSHETQAKTADRHNDGHEDDTDKDEGDMTIATFPLS